MLTREQSKKMFKREVYRNLHFRDEVVYSVRKDGLVEGHALCHVMDGVTFSVGPKGNQRVRDEERKNVHAVIRGHVINAVWYDEEELDFAKSAAKDLAQIEMCGVPVSQNTDVSDLDDPRAWEPMYEWVEVKYNPYKFKTFVAVDGDKLTPIFNARKVVIYSEDNKSKVMAMIPIKKSDKN
tara:strand:- start:254 stop:796 length:543 start_codon:yes stop_codon:yes gene_type:complete